MANQIRWDYINPINYGQANALFSRGQDQVANAIQNINNAVLGYASDVKQRNTDDILNALYQAQNSADLPNAMAAVNSLQQQYGRGFDQAAVRNAIDTRGQVLGQRDLQNINLQQAQAAQAAIPTLNQAFATQAINQGADASTVNGLAGLGINAADAIRSLGSTAQEQSRYSTEYADRRGDIAYNRAYQIGRDAVTDANTDRQFGLAEQNSAIQLAQYAAPNAGVNTTYIDADGNTVTSAQPSRLEALGAVAGLVGKITGAESGNNPTAKNPKSTATGVGQFIGDTWLSMMQKYKPELTRGKSKEQILAMRNDPNLSSELTGRYAQENSEMLRKNNLPVNDGTIYLAHFAGPEGARKLLTANPNTSAESILGSKVAKANGNIVKGKTAQDVINWAAKTIGGSSGSSSTAVRGITPQALTAVRTGYSTAIDKVTNDYNVAKNKANQKGSAAAGGLTPDKWLAKQDETSWTGGSSNPIFTKAADVVEMAKTSKAYNDLPPDAQANILDAAYSRVKNAGAFRYETNKSVKTIIDNEAKAYKQNQIANFNQGKQNAVNAAITQLTQQYTAAGVKPPTRQQAIKLIDPTLYNQLYGKKK